MQNYKVTLLLEYKDVFKIAYRNSRNFSIKINKIAFDFYVLRKSEFLTPLYENNFYKYDRILYNIIYIVVVLQQY
jgi:hypothetical protein